jgi:hypothetical protein
MKRNRLEWFQSLTGLPEINETPALMAKADLFKIHGLRESEVSLP